MSAAAAAAAASTGIHFHLSVPTLPTCSCGIRSAVNKVLLSGLVGKINV